MILEVPFVYTALAILGRKRNPDKVILRASVACQVREATAAQAPAVLWWQGKHYHPQDCLRWYDGRLYAPMQQPEERLGRLASTGLEAPADASAARRWNPAGRPDDSEEADDEFGKPLDASGEGDAPELPPGCRQLVSTASFAAALAKGTARISGLTASSEAASEPEHELTADGMLARRNSREPPQPLRRFASSPLETLRANISAGTARLLDVDGVLFAEVARPVYKLRTYHVSRPELHRGFADARPDLHLHVFAAENHAQMLDLQRELWTKGNPGQDFPEGGYFMAEIPAPDIVRPDLLPAFDQTENLVNQGARAILDHLASRAHDNWGGNGPGPIVSRYPRDVILGFGLLRDALAAAAPAAEIVDHMARLGEACRPHGTLSAVQAQAEIACARAEAAFADAFALGAI